MKTLLVSMPFGALDRQALGLSLLKPRVEERGFKCEVRYLTFPFAELIGKDEYQWLNYEAPYTAFAGDWAFTEALYGKRPEADARYIDQVLRGEWRFTEASITRLLRVRTMTHHFLDHCMEAVKWRDYSLVGFTSTFEQNIASLALAKRLKERYPTLRVVFGGANWEGEMGEEFHRRFPFVDYVCGGESEVSFPELVDRVAKAAPLHEDPIPGVVYRRRGSTCGGGQPDRVRHMDDLPLPDYTDYFSDLNNSTVSAEVYPTLLIETSRGCWWGAKSHCTFCGLNGGSMAFRSKSQTRALSELKTLADLWRVDMVEAVDNILDMSYFQEFVPALAAHKHGMHIFYEVKANLDRRQLRLLRDAGITRVQPGIESLSDHVLQLMRKGTTGIRNIQLLKWCREYGITSDWNLLYGFPGETKEDTESLQRLLPQIRHLHPPTACGPLRLDRFSPYHASPDAYGIGNVRAMSTYRHLYPFEQASLNRLAYYFDFDYAPGTDPRPNMQEIVRYCDEWKRNPEPGTLTAVRRPDGSLGLVDTRSTAQAPASVLHGSGQAAYEYCDEAHTLPAIRRHLADLGHFAGTGDNELAGMLADFVRRGLMVTDGKSYLSLAQATKPLRKEWEDRKPARMHTAIAPAPAALPSLHVLPA